MTRPADFALQSPSLDTQKTCYCLLVEKIQQFSIDADIPFNQVLDMPMHLMDDFYLKGAWNIQKAYNESRDQIRMNSYQMLQNIEVLLRAIQKRI